MLNHNNNNNPDADHRNIQRPRNNPNLSQSLTPHRLITKKQMKVKYKTIQAFDVEAFNKRCDEMDKGGWVPFGGISVAITSVDNHDPLVVYAQQWSKPV